jgi:hypothetical protein
MGGGGRSGIAGGFAEHLGLDRPGAAAAPPGGDHFLDQAELEAIDGLDPLDVMGQRFPILGEERSLRV